MKRDLRIVAVNPHHKESLMDEEVLKKLKRERILNRLTEEEKEILGVE